MPNESEELSKLRSRLLLLKEECRTIGQLPPRPATMRASAGALLVSIVRRTMFWYTPPIRQAVEGLAEIVEELIPQIAGLEQRLVEQVYTLQQEGQRTAGLETRLQEQTHALQQESLRTATLEQRLVEQVHTLQQEGQRTAGLETRLQEQTHALQHESHHLAGLEQQLQVQAEALRHESQRTTGLDDRLQALLSESHLQEQLESLRQERARIAEILQQERLCTIELETRLREQVDSMEQLHEDHLSENAKFAGRLQKSEERLHSLRLEILEQSRRTSHLLEEARKRLPASPDGEAARVFEQEAQHDLDPLYLSFEDEFRGSREEVRQRLRGYVPLLQQAQTLDREFVVLDIGCGRGEWLELLRQEGFHARGVDSNRVMVEECRERQLEVEAADALEYVSRLPSGSMGSVTVFHLVEHLPFRKLIRLLDEVARILQPGGLAIFETPNPDNVLVGSRNFYYDPTHRNPIPSATLRFLVEARGLCQVKVLPLNPCDDCNRVPDESPLAQRFNDYFYGPQDYAVVGKKV